MEQSVDQMRILGSLGSHGVEYVLVGELATAFHGGPSTPAGIEICLPGDQQNLARMALVLQYVLAKESPVSPGGDHHAVFETRYGLLDCLEDDASFATFLANATDVDLGDDIVARVASLADLTRLKERSDDVSGAVRLAALAASAEIASDDEDPDEEPRPEGRFARIVQRLADVDDFLTDVNEGKRALRRAKN
jgi:hypothetical protein